MKACNFFNSSKCQAVTCTLSEQNNEICEVGELHIFSKKEVEAELKNLIAAHKRDGYPIELHDLMKTFKKYDTHKRVEAEDYNILAKLIEEER